MTEAELIEKVARAICASDGNDFDEVCGVDANPDEGYCDSGTCVASCWEEHDAEQARRWYRHLAQAAIAAMREAMVPVGWMYKHNGMERSLVARERTQDPDWLIGKGWTETPLFAWPEGGA